MAVIKRFSFSFCEYHSPVEAITTSSPTFQFTESTNLIYFILIKSNKVLTSKLLSCTT